MAASRLSASASASSRLPKSLSAQHSVPQRTDSGRIAAGYVRVSAAVQSQDGLPLDAQRQAIKNHRITHDLRLFKLYEDMESGGKSDRIDLKEALAQKADGFVVLKFDRLSRSIKHFCQKYEEHFASRT